MSAEPPKLSVVVLTANSAAHLEQCLASVAWAQEIVVLDYESSDATLEICRRHPARIYPQPEEVLKQAYGNFDIVKNVGFDLAAGPWILSLDADEVVTESLRQEILDVLKDNPQQSFYLPRQNLYWRKPVRLLGADCQMRLFQKGAVQYLGIHLDQKPVVAGNTAHFKNPLVHYAIDNLSAFAKKIRVRTSLRARALRQDGRTIPWHSSLSTLPRVFLFYAFKQQAFRDGMLGLWVSLLYAWEEELTQLKYMLRHR